MLQRNHWGQIFVSVYTAYIKYGYDSALSVSGPFTLAGEAIMTVLVELQLLE